MAANPTFTARTFVRLRHAGINTVIVESSRLLPAQVSRLTRLTRWAHLRVVRQPVGLPRPATAANAQAVCDSFRSAHPGSPCALVAASYFTAVALAQSGAPDLVVVRLASPGVVRALPAPRSGRVLAVPSLGRRFRARTWRGAIGLASASSSAALDLGFAPQRAGQRTFSQYLGTLKTSGATSKDRKAPSSPTGLTLIQQTTTLLGVRWQASTDNRGVAGYDFYVDGTLAGTTTSTSDSASDLQCGTLHKLTVDAFDAAGNRSGKTTIGASTTQCVVGPPSDSLPPSTPGGLRVSGRTTSSISVAWTSSVDNVGVVGYGIYRNNVPVGTTQGTDFRADGPRLRHLVRPRC